jgi:hypothetical protein
LFNGDCYGMFRIFSILLVVLFFSSSCKKKAKVVQDNIAYQTVNLTIYPGEPLYFKLAPVGGWMYIRGGVNGIIVYRKAQNSAADFVAIERTSTQLPDNPDALVKVQSDNFTLKDTISGSTWQITDGVVLSGPAQLPLRLYSTLYDNGTGALHIRN